MTLVFGAGGLLVAAAIAAALMFPPDRGDADPTATPSTVVEVPQVAVVPVTETAAPPVVADQGGNGREAPPQDRGGTDREAAVDRGEPQPTTPPPDEDTTTPPPTSTTTTTTSEAPTTTLTDGPVIPIDPPDDVVPAPVGPLNPPDGAEGGAENPDAAGDGTPSG